MKKVLSLIMAVLISAGCGNNAAVTSETTAQATTTAEVTTTTTVETTTTAVATNAETTTETTAEEITAVPAPVPEMSDECRALYAAFLTDIIQNDARFTGNAAFDLYDLDSDGVPELFLSRGDQYPAEAYACTDSGVKQLTDRFSDAPGSAYVCENYLFVGYSVTGDNTAFIYRKNGDEAELLAKLEDIFSQEKGQKLQTSFYINDKEVTKEEYDAEWEKYPEGLENVGRRYQLNTQNINKIFG